jgi:hypothetical protein
MFIRSPSAEPIDLMAENYYLDEEEQMTSTH